jgi:uncharacterized protein involved in exopolysaccharide biosynthesis
MVRQYESAKLDEAKEGPLLQQIDKALPPDFKSKPSRASMVLTATLLALLGSISWVIVRAYMRLRRDALGEQAPAWLAARQAWRLRA